MTFKIDELHLIALELSKGLHGSFAQAIGDAYLVADKDNRAKLVAAFDDVFCRGWYAYHWKANNAMLHQA